MLEASRVGCGETRAVWLLLHRPSSAVPVTASFHNTLKFTTKDWDSASGEVDDSSAMPDQYQIEDVEISLADYIKGTTVEEFAARWEELGEEHECTETFSLSNAKSLQGKCWSLAYDESSYHVPSHSTHSSSHRGCEGHTRLLGHDTAREERSCAC